MTDSERMDWLEAHMAAAPYWNNLTSGRTIRVTCPPFGPLNGVAGEGTTVREAIDAARSAAQETPNE